MKKAILLIAVLLLVGSFVFAQDAGIKIGAWGRGIFVPVMGSGSKNLLTATHASWGWAPRVGMTISGTSPNVGFQADFNVDGGSLAVGDNQKIWVKPMDMITIQMGNIYDDTLRGNAGNYGLWNWLRVATMSGEDVVFERIGIANFMGGDKANFEVAIAPIEGLYVFGAVKGILGGSGVTKDVLQLGQYGAGYTIPNIGVIRAQYIGETVDNSVVDAFGIINAAFKLTAVDKLTVDVGAKIPTDADAAGMNAGIGIAGSYSMDALSLNVSGNVMLPNKDFSDTLEAMDFSTIGIEAGIGASYSVGGGISVEGEFLYQNDASTVINAATSFLKQSIKNPATAVMPTFYEDGVISGMVGATMGFSNGLIGVALELTTGNFVGNSSSDITKGKLSDVVWSVPVKFEFFF